MLLLVLLVIGSTSCPTPLTTTASDTWIKMPDCGAVSAASLGSVEVVVSAVSSRSVEAALSWASVGSVEAYYHGLF